MAFLSSYRQHEIYTMLFDKIELLSVDKFCKTIKKIQLAIFLENRQYPGRKMERSYLESIVSGRLCTCSIFIKRCI